MKITSKITLALAMMLGLGIGSSYAQSATAPATMEIQTALAIVLETGSTIDFGNVSATTPGAVFLDPKGLANVSTGATTDVAQFNVTGGANAGITVTYDPTVAMTATSGSALTSNGGGAAILTLTPSVVGAQLVGGQNTAAAIGIGPAGTVTLAPVGDANAGKYFIWVGGTIPPLTTQATGEYAGTFNIAVAYN